MPLSYYTQSGNVTLCQDALALNLKSSRGIREVTHTIQNKVQIFFHRCLRILRIRWPHKITNLSLWKIINKKELQQKFKKVELGRTHTNKRRQCSGKNCFGLESSGLQRKRKNEKHVKKNRHSRNHQRRKNMELN